MRYLVVNADDLGLSLGVNRGIIRAHEAGIVTSASLMVRHPAAAAAAEYARARPALGLGLHLDLGEWSGRGGEWVPVYQVVDFDDPAALAGEVDRQLAEFEQIAGRPPTHIDSHQHVHRSEPLRRLVADQGRRLGIPVRHLTPGVRYCGDFYGQGRYNDPLPQAITAEALVRLVSSLPPGVTEIACHPGDDPALASDYRDERPLEVAALCDPAVRRAVADGGVTLCTFADVSRLLGEADARGRA